MTTPPLVTTYRRCSSVKQIDGDSFRRQADPFGTWMEEHGAVPHPTLPTLEDGGVSGFASKKIGRGRSAPKNVLRGDLGRYLRAIERGEVGEGCVLLVESYDRLGRDEPADAFERLMKIVNSQIRVVTFSPNVYELKKGDMAGEIVARTVVEQAHVYSKHLSYRVRESWKPESEKVKNGGGFVRNLPHWVRRGENSSKIAGKETGEYEIDEERAVIVRQIVKRYLHGESAVGIASDLNQRNVPSPQAHTSKKQCKWSPHTIRRTVRNPGLLGRAVVRGEPVGPVIWDPIVDEKTWARLHAATVRRKRSGANRRKKSDRVNLFGRLLYDVRAEATPMICVRPGKNRKPQRTFRVDGVRYDRKKTVDVPETEMEWAILQAVDDLTAGEFSRDDKSGDDGVAEAKAEVLRLTGRIEETQEDYYNHGGKLVAEVLRQLESRLEEAKSDLLEAEAQAGADKPRNVIDGWITTRQRLSRCEPGELPAVRGHLADILSSAINRIDYAAANVGRTRAVLAEIVLTSGNVRRVGWLHDPRDADRAVGVYVPLPVGSPRLREVLPAWDSYFADVKTGRGGPGRAAKSIKRAIADLVVKVDVSTCRPVMSDWIEHVHKIAREHTSHRHDSRQITTDEYQRIRAELGGI